MKGKASGSIYFRFLEINSAMNISDQIQQINRNAPATWFSAKVSSSVQLNYVKVNNWPVFWQEKIWPDGRCFLDLQTTFRKT